MYNCNCHLYQIIRETEYEKETIEMVQHLKKGPSLKNVFDECLIYQNVSTERIVICSVSRSEKSDERIKFILGQSLKNSGSSDQRSNGRWKGGSEASGVDQVSGEGDSTHGLQEIKKSDFRLGVTWNSSLMGNGIWGASFTKLLFKAFLADILTAVKRQNPDNRNPDAPASDFVQFSVTQNRTLNFWK